MKKLLLLILPLLIFSCSNEISELVQTPEGDYEVYNFEYNGEQYSVKYYYAADSTVVFEDPSMKEFIEKIDEEPELMTLVNEDGSISLYENREVYLMLNKTNGQNAENKGIQTRAIHNIEVALFDEFNYGGGKFSIRHVTNIIPHRVYPNLKTENFEDKASSAKIINGEKLGTLVATFYEKRFFEGKSLVFRAKPNSTTFVPQLNQYKLSSGFLGIGKKNWNNKISSVTVVLEY